MDQTEENEGDDGKEGPKKDVYFIVDSWSLEDEEEKSFNLRRYWKSCKQIKGPNRENSPPLLLVSSNSGKPPQASFLDGGADLQQEWEQEDEDGHLPIEDWMILDDKEHEGDSSIQLNLSYSYTPEEEFGDKDMTKVTSLKDAWAVSKKDKHGAKLSLPNCNSGSNHSLICHICNRMGHLAKSCYPYKKSPTCFLCGIRGHIQKACPGRPCPTCGLPSHGLRNCEIPPMWNQRCQRCGMTGHLSDACPDTWRQFHLTIRLGAPLKPQTSKNLKSKRSCAHCYNCSKRGHYGHECPKRRMVSGTFPSLPFICRYDTTEDILQHCTTIQERRAKERVGLSSDPGRTSEKKGDCTGENLFAQLGRSRRKQEGSSRAGRMKTWPERRKEKREMKQRRREAQAIREGSLVGRSHYNSDYEAYPMNPFGHLPPGHKQFMFPLKKRKDEEDWRSRKSRETGWWKKRRGMKRANSYP